MIADRFWKTFWTLFGTVALVGLTLAVSLFLLYTRPVDLFAAVGASFDPSKDPFQNGTLGSIAEAFSLNGGYLYQNALPVRFKSWSWSTAADWRSSAQKFSGAYAIKAQFMRSGGSFGMNGPVVEISDYTSVSLEVYPDASVGDLYIDLYGADGLSIGRQSLGWYLGDASPTADANTTQPALAPNAWQRVVVPLNNFTEGAQRPPKVISGFSISSKNAGTAYVDEVRLTKDTSTRALWVAPPEVAGAAFNPFATSSPASLPYTFSPSPESLTRWYSYFGIFAPGPNGEMQAGPSSENKTTGSMTVFRGGLLWNDYRVETSLDWGQVSAFSVLVRFVDDGNFVSCAFSHYGDGAQIYLVRNGVSEPVAQSPGLPTKAYEPWKDVHVGAQVVGNRVSCLIDGSPVLSADMPGTKGSGTAGFETWDPNTFAAPHTLHSFVVTPVSRE
ncbi:MAG TPA: hypothetical protein VHD31_02105 [Candidatus Paceibacterota bacterium]|nr:hypothetical protein [Candidatus Paceibacterota bacterium]